MAARITMQQAKRFHNQVIEALTRLQAISTPQGPRDYQVATKAGALHISIHADWIACQFRDPALAEKTMGTSNGRLNIHSGKWNWHGLDCVELFEDAASQLVHTTTQD